MPTINDRRATALAAFHAARETPAAADWQAIAETLAALLPASPKQSAEIVDATGTWIDYTVPRSAKVVWPSPVLQVTFADGITKRAGALSIKGRPVNWGRAVRNAVAFHSMDGQRFPSPIVAVTCEATGKEYDASLAERKAGLWARLDEMTAPEKSTAA